MPETKKVKPLSLEEAWEAAEREQTALARQAADESGRTAPVTNQEKEDLEANPQKNMNVLVCGVGAGKGMQGPDTDAAGEWEAEGEGE